MTENLTPISEAEMARNAMKPLLEAWKSSWTSGDKGPTVIGDFLRGYISDEQQLANRPEELAYVALVDGVAAALTFSAHSQQHREVLEELRGLLDGETRISTGDKQRMIADIAARTIDLLVSAD